MKTRRFIFSITAHISLERGNETSMVIFEEYANIESTYAYKSNPIYELAHKVMPFVKWEFDDGDDKRGTNYCQYCSYEAGTDNYLLAAWNEIDENGHVVF